MEDYGGIDMQADPFRKVGKLWWPHYVTGAVLVPWRLRLLAGLGVVAYVVVWASEAKDRMVSRRAGEAELRVHLLQMIGRAMTLVMGFVRVEQLGEPSREARIIVANHSSLMDAFFLFGSSLAPTFVAKREVMAMPVFGPVARVLGCITVDRRSGSSRSGTMDSILDHTGNAATRPLVIFPEGTTTNATALMRFRRGAFVPGSPVQPVAIRYPSPDGFSPTFPPHASSLWTMLGLLARPINRVQLNFLPVVQPLPEWRANPDLYAAAVERILSAQLNIPISTYTLSDFVRLQKKN